jgi:hypothetical protein
MFANSKWWTVDFRAAPKQFAENSVSYQGIALAIPQVLRNQLPLEELDVEFEFFSNLQMRNVFHALLARL